MIKVMVMEMICWFLPFSQPSIKKNKTNKLIEKEQIEQSAETNKPT